MCHDKFSRSNYELDESLKSLFILNLKTITQIRNMMYAWTELLPFESQSQKIINIVPTLADSKNTSSVIDLISHKMVARAMPGNM